MNMYLFIQIQVTIDDTILLKSGLLLIEEDCYINQTKQKKIRFYPN